MKLIHTTQESWQPALDKGPFSNRRKPLMEGGLGVSLWELPPGKKSFPFHSHHVTEEGLYVLSGTAKVRTPEGLTALSAGDFVAFPAGSGAHQLINDSAEPFVYLGLSASKGFDLVDYPDSGKVAVAQGSYPTGKRLVFKTKDQADYFDGEL